MRLFAVVVLVLSIVATGCRSAKDTTGKVMLDGKEIVSVKLECADFCKRVGTPPFPPFTEKTFAKENGNALNVFRKAIVNAEKMNGVLNYVVIFYMYLLFDDGAQKKYVLNVADEDGMNALLVDTEESSQGYTISKDLTSELRSFIYGG
ncbi:hypothetical protein [Cohnella sp. GbtcB17]|uniref:hypothetical protein n=1 Tax=Cohnella sp. GbtcB17 TaxID=2824762 RepID=UPI001C2FC4DC|nr:hypothetical protein [Cohnella sp. GbtcB17]